MTEPMVAPTDEQVKAVLQQIARMENPIAGERLKDVSTPQIVGETLAFLANKYSGPNHEELWRKVTSVLKEIERLRND